jgi:hypothetical protein
MNLLLRDFSADKLIYTQVRHRDKLLFRPVCNLNSILLKILLIWDGETLDFPIMLTATLPELSPLVPTKSPRLLLTMLIGITSASELR